MTALVSPLMAAATVTGWLAFVAAVAVGCGHAMRLRDRRG